MKNRRNYYRILHVQPDAPPAVIRSSYRTIMHKMRVHPDLGGDAEAAALVNEAYAVLGDEQKRADYDRIRQNPGWTRSANDDFRQGLVLTHADAHAPAPACAFCGWPVPPETPGEELTAFCRICHSPLAPMSRLVSHDADRRAITRVPKKSSLLVWTSCPQAQPYAGQVNDLSLTGMRFDTGVFLAAEQVLKIDTPVLKAVATVVRCTVREAGYEVGACFQNLCFARSRGSFVEARA
ncbi:MAG: hypothetical protein CME59_21855 [Halioglobus sp.]|nr:hypothetical protein [Halioglobus sp.]